MMGKLEVKYKATLEINVEIDRDGISDEMIEKIRAGLTDEIRELIQEEIVDDPPQGQVIVTEQLNEVTYKENDNEGI